MSECEKLMEDVRNGRVRTPLNSPEVRLATCPFSYEMSRIFNQCFSGGDQDFPSHWGVVGVEPVGGAARALADLLRGCCESVPGLSLLHRYSQVVLMLRWPSVGISLIVLFSQRMRQILRAESRRVFRLQSRKVLRRGRNENSLTKEAWKSCVRMMLSWRHLRLGVAWKAANCISNALKRF